MSFRTRERLEQALNQLLIWLQNQIAEYRHYRWLRQRCPHGMPGGLTRNLCAECLVEAEQEARAVQLRRAEEMRLQREVAERRLISELRRQQEEQERQRRLQREEEERRRHREEEERKAILRKKAAQLQEQELAKARVIRLHRHTSLLALPPREFERAVADLYTRLGFQVELTPAVSDFGVDILAKKDGVVYAIECKKWAPKQSVGRQHVQKLHSGMGVWNATRGIFVTTSRFRAPARKFAEQFAIELVSGTELCEMFANAFPVRGSAEHFHVMCTECGQVLRFPILDKLLRAKCQRGHTVFCDSRPPRKEPKEKSPSRKASVPKKAKSGGAKRRRRYRRW